MQKQSDQLAKKRGILIIERDFLEGKLKSLVSFDTRKEMVETKHTISLNRQLELFG